MSKEQIDDLKALHYKVMGHIKQREWNKLNKMMKDVRYTHDVNKAKMVLVATQEFVEKPEILEERFLLYKSFNEDLGQGFRNNMNIFIMKDPNVPQKHKPNEQ